MRLVTKKQKSFGFTLIELLIVIAIIGLLSSIVMASVAAARQKAVINNAQSFAQQLMKALELYSLYNQNSYPQTPQLASNNCSIYGPEMGGGADVCWGQLKSILSAYAPNLPGTRLPDKEVWWMTYFGPGFTSGLNGTQCYATNNGYILQLQYGILTPNANSIIFPGDYTIFGGDSVLGTWTGTGSSRRCQ